MKFTTIAMRGKVLLKKNQTITEKEGIEFYGKELFENAKKAGYFDMLNVKIRNTSPTTTV